MKKIWELSNTGLIFLDYTDTNNINLLKWKLTEYGEKVLNDESFFLYDVNSYLETIKSKIPLIDDTILFYLKESLHSFKAGCWIASSVMLGVASEKLFYIVADAFSDWLSENEGQRLKNDISRKPLSAAIDEYEKKLRTHMPEINSSFAESEFELKPDLDLNYFRDIVRVYRNRTGHPTGFKIEKSQVYNNLICFSYHCEKYYALIKVFIDNNKN